MPKYDETYAAVIKNGVVENTIVVDPEMDGYEEFIASLDADAVEIVGKRDRPSPGWVVEGNDWHAPEPTPEDVAAQEAAEAEAAERETERQAVVEKAKDAGLTDDDIEALRR